jgi:predicted DNA-binding transcriptional regulator AlpA
VTQNNAQPDGKQELLRPNKAADLLDVSIRTLQEWRRTGDGPRFVRLSPRAVRYRRSDIEAWLEGQLA